MSLMEEHLGIDVKWGSGVIPAAKIKTKILRLLADFVREWIRLMKKYAKILVPYDTGKLYRSVESGLTQSTYRNLWIRATAMSTGKNPIDYAPIVNAGITRSGKPMRYHPRRGHASGAKPGWYQELALRGARIMPRILERLVRTSGLEAKVEKALGVQLDAGDVMEMLFIGPNIKDVVRFT